MHLQHRVEYDKIRQADALLHELFQVRHLKKRTLPYTLPSTYQFLQLYYFHLLQQFLKILKQALLRRVQDYLYKDCDLLPHMLQLHV